MHIHYKETYIFSPFHSIPFSHSIFSPNLTLVLRSVSSHLLCVSLMLKESSSLSYHFFLTLKYCRTFQLALSASSLILVAVLFCSCPTSTTGSFKNPRAGASSYCFSPCVLFTISHAQEVLNMCLLIVTLVALSMYLGWKRDFLSCST